VIRLVLLIGALLVAAVGWMAGLGRAPAARPAPEPTPASRGPSPRVERADQRFEITEAVLSERLSQQLVGQSLGTTPVGPATLERVSVQLRNGHIAANGDAQVAATSVPVSMTARGTVERGRVLVKLDDLRVAGVPLPSSARDSVQHSLQAQVDAEVDRLQLEVSSLSIDAGKLVLVGERR
jgi:LmeA-like phospholipid-binding